MIAIVGWLGSALCVWSLVQNDPKRFRALNLGACVVLTVSNVGTATWSAAILNLVVAAINIRQLLVLRAATKAAAVEAFAAAVEAFAAAVAELSRSEVVLEAA